MSEECAKYPEVSSQIYNAISHSKLDSGNLKDLQFVPNIIKYAPMACTTWVR